MKKDELFEIREFSEEVDLAFIVSSMKQGAYFGIPFFRMIERKLFEAHFVPAIKKVLLTRPLVGAYVACLKEDPSVNLGYSILEGDRHLHWVYVKPEWRRIGIARTLVPESIESCSFITKEARKFMPKHIKMNPFRFGG